MSSIKQHIKDPVSSLTHLFGAFLGLIATFYMVVSAVETGDQTRLIAVFIFGISMVLLYTASGLYHFFIFDAAGSLRMQKLDHSMIFVLIAGTYTPYCLLTMEGVAKWTLFYGIWGIAIVGILFKVIWFNAPRWLSTVIYLLMGWIAVFSISSMNIGPEALFWTIAGGVSYSVGAIIYIFKKPDPWPEWFGFHEIWHLFVLGGTFCHFWAISQYM
jgi:hemolysin III